jgi:hypothetical protein
MSNGPELWAAVCCTYIPDIFFKYTESVWMNLSFSVSFRSCRGDSGMFRELGINNHPSSCSHVLWADQGRYKARFAFHPPPVDRGTCTPHSALSSKRVSERGSDRLSGQMYPAFGYSVGFRPDVRCDIAIQTGVLNQLEFSSKMNSAPASLDAGVCVFFTAGAYGCTLVTCGDFRHLLCSGGKTVFPPP